jgi:hypothetical protein
VTRRWRRVPLEAELERLVMAQQAEDEARRSGRNCDAAVEEVRLAQTVVDRIRNGISRQPLGGLRYGADVSDL